MLYIFNGKILDLEELPVHAGLMLFGLILIITGFIIARKKKSIKKWVVKHKFIAIFGVLSCLTGLIMGIRMVGENFENHIRTPHAIFGLITISILSITPILGQTIFWLAKKKSLIKRVKSFRILHRWVGRTTILIVSSTIILGLLRVFA